MAININELISEGNLIGAAKALFNASKIRNLFPPKYILNAYNRLAQKYMSEGDFDNAKRIMDLMLLLGFTPFVETFIIFLNKYAFDGNVDKIISILKIMSEKNIALPIKHYRKMLKQLVFGKKDRDAALYLIRYMEETIVPASFLEIINSGIKKRRDLVQYIVPWNKEEILPEILPPGYTKEKISDFIADIINIQRYRILLKERAFTNNLEMQSSLWMMTAKEGYRHDFPEFLHCYNVVFKLDEMEEYLKTRL